MVLYGEGYCLVSVESPCQQAMYLKIMLGLNIFSVSYFHGINIDFAPGTMLSFLLLAIG